MSVVCIKNGVKFVFKTIQKLLDLNVPWKKE